jgi:hypothetical protein
LHIFIGSEVPGKLRPRVGLKVELPKEVSHHSVHPLRARVLLSVLGVNIG